MITPNQRLAGIVVIVAILLLIPFLAMRFTGEVNWTRIDFITAGVLLLGTGLLCELVLRVVRKTQYRIVLVAAILLGLFLVWAELAVGLFGTRFAGS
ncbi:MAG: hypothetical protein DMF63_03835 [Acidobacteria bacterium]|nr:MAG: hypothetical protein DMF63_03835 [Acidobacteriota bacterium]